MKSSTTVQPATIAHEATGSEEARYLFESFEWHSVPRGSGILCQHADFTGEVRDIANGVQTVMQMIEQDDADGEGCDHNGKALPKLFNQFHKSNLMRLCITSLDLLAKKAEKSCEDAQKMARAAHARHA